MVPRNTRRYYVLVNPEGIDLKILVPMEYFEDPEDVSPDEGFPVFHLYVYLKELFKD